MSQIATMHQRARDAESELAELRATVDTLLAEHVGPTLGALAGQAEATVREAGEELRQRADRVSADLRDQARRLAGVVQERPLLAVGLAALAGYALATLARR